MNPHSPPSRRTPSALVLALGLALALPGRAQDATVDAPGAQAADAAIVPSVPEHEAGVQPAADAAAAPPAQGAEARPAPPVDAPAHEAPANAEADPATDAPATAEQAVATTPADDPATTAEAVTDTGSPTAAEDDFQALYGSGDEATSTAPAAYDPWERYNRRMHRFNNAVDRRVARPLARAYVRVVPAPVRSGVSNFFSNLGQPVSAINALLQGKPKQAAHSLGRFVLNSTLGIGGVFDPATAAKLENRSEDFGQTLGVWGWRRSRYVELPLFGPRTLRDVVGMGGDAPLSPLRQIEADRIRVPLQGMQLVDLRAQLLSTDALREGVEDDYALVRDAWSQRRDYQIFGDRDESLPDYLRQEPGMVPVDAMPVPIEH